MWEEYRNDARKTQRIDTIGISINVITMHFRNFEWIYFMIQQLKNVYNRSIVEFTCHTWL